MKYIFTILVFFALHLSSCKEDSISVERTEIPFQDNYTVNIVLYEYDYDLDSLVEIGINFHLSFDVSKSRHRTFFSNCFGSLDLFYDKYGYKQFKFFNTFVFSSLEFNYRYILDDYSYDLLPGIVTKSWGNVRFYYEENFDTTINYNADYIYNFDSNNYLEKMIVNETTAQPYIVKLKHEKGKIIEKNIFNGEELKEEYKYIYNGKSKFVDTLKIYNNDLKETKVIGYSRDKENMLTKVGGYSLISNYERPSKSKRIFYNTSLKVLKIESGDPQFYYKYDANNKLIHVDIFGDSGVRFIRRSYNYDEINRISTIYVSKIDVDFSEIDTVHKIVFNYDK